jgi:hypothetical protein
MIGTFDPFDDRYAGVLWVASGVEEDVTEEEISAL